MKREACVWDQCLLLSDDAVLGVTLIFEGKSFSKKRVPVCADHLRRFRETGRMTLRPEFLYAAERR